MKKSKFGMFYNTVPLLTISIISIVFIISYIQENNLNMIKLLSAFINKLNICVYTYMNLCLEIYMHVYTYIHIQK